MNLFSFTALALVLLCCLSEGLFLMFRQQGRHWLGFGFKGLASLSFCLLGFLVCLGTGGGYLIPTGLLLGFLGDQLLALRKLDGKNHDRYFGLGALSFCLGHCFYMAYLLTAHKGLLPWAAVIFPVLVLLSEVFARISGFAKDKMHLPGLFYIAVEAAMCALALSALGKDPGPGTLLFSLGGLSFLVSDNLLCAFSFGRLRSRAADWLLHLTYIAAQLLIALSPLFPG